MPRDPRTFLKATKDVSVLPISGGVFYNFDIKKPLEMILKEYNLKDEITFSLQFNIDGLPLHKSTGKQFWPILVRIVSPFKSKISTIGVYYGKSKPSNLEFLNKFIQELKDLLSNGIAFNGKNFLFSLEVALPFTFLLLKRLSLNLSIPFCVSKKNSYTL